MNLGKLQKFSDRQPGRLPFPFYLFFFMKTSEITIDCEKGGGVNKLINYRTVTCHRPASTMIRPSPQDTHSLDKHIEEVDLWHNGIENRGRNTYTMISYYEMG